MSKILKSLTEEIQCGVFGPLPAEVFESQTGVVDVFRHLRSGSKIEKVVIRLQGIQAPIGIVIITGGLGGLGGLCLVKAETIVDMGADHVVLVSRSGQVKDYEEQKCNESLMKLLELNNSSLVSVECYDMSDDASMELDLETVHQKNGCINKLIHASAHHQHLTIAMVLNKSFR